MPVGGRSLSIDLPDLLMDGLCPTAVGDSESAGVTGIVMLEAIDIVRWTPSPLDEAILVVRVCDPGCGG